VPLSPVFEKSRKFNLDKAFEKVNLGVGAYRTDEGKPWVLPVVLEVEASILEKLKTGELNHEYPTIAGNPEFVKAAAAFALGDHHPAITEGRVDGIQAIGGTGAVTIAAHFLGGKHSCKDVYVSDPTWGNHINIFQRAGMNVRKYRYYKKETRSLDFEGLMEDLTNAPQHAVVVLHACAHNPTGVDPTPEQWTQIATVIQARELFPVFDMAYQGFVSGNPDEDAAAVRYFASLNMTMFICQSFSKNFGLYSERIGCFTVLAKTKEITSAIISNSRTVVRSLWSNPPQQGARIVAAVLNTPELRARWREQLKTMSTRVFEMRKALRDALIKVGAPGNWDHMINQRGLFTYTGLNEEQCIALERDHHIYLLNTGRINMCGINTHNVEYVARAFHSVLGSAHL
jgi:aspartate aminotransferase